MMIRRVRQIPANLFRMKKRAKSYLKRQSTCPECGFVFALSFLLNASRFSEEEKKMGGKQIVCPSCKKPLWLNSRGEIEPVVVKAEAEDARERPAWWIRCAFCVAICRLIRKIKGLPPKSN